MLTDGGAVIQSSVLRVGGATHTEIEQYETETLAVNSLNSEIMLKISD